MMDSGGLYDLVEADPETAKKVQDEINVILEKYNVEVGVKSSINIWQRQMKSSIPSPFTPPPKENGNSESSTA